MSIDDSLLPAARHLTGPDASELLVTAVGSFGGTLLSSQLVQVQHRPGHDLVVRFDAMVAWEGGDPRRETLLAASTTSGAPDGSLVLTAGDLEVGVWRYPFDPVLPGLATAVTPARVAELLPRGLGAKPHVEVVAYRPMRRAVVRATGDDFTAYLKLVAPHRARGIVARHELLRSAGLPVPQVLDVDEEQGLLVLEALPGENLRDRLLHSTDGWPAASAYAALMRALTDVTVPPDTFGAPWAATAGDLAEGHGRALRAIVPTEADRLVRITTAVSALPPGPPPTTLIHGDLYEAQLLVDDDARLAGLLDLDDVRVGHPLDDAATLLAHLTILQPATRSHRTHLQRYRRALRDAALEASASSRAGVELDLRVAGVVVGLATGPFRAQRQQWRREVRRRLAIADRLVARSSPSEREKTLSQAS